MHGASQTDRPPSFGAPTTRGLRSRDPDAARVLDVVASSLGVSADVMLDRTRLQEIAKARQLAIYLIHVSLRRTILDSAKVLGRDRTTGSYACARVEEWREDQAFDAEVARLETLIVEPRREKRRAAR